MNVENDFSLPDDLINEGIDWAREEFVAGRSRDLKKFLRTSFIASLEIFDFHRAALAKKIEFAGGISKITDRFWSFDRELNGIYCENGNFIPAFEILTTPVFNTPLPCQSSFGVDQIYRLEILYGGKGIGIDSERIKEDANWAHLMADRPLEKFFDPGFSPGEICIAESVVSSYGGKEHTAVNNYCLSVEVWYAKLRKEFARGWDMEPIQVTDMLFRASRARVGDNGKKYREMVTYVDRYGFTKETGEAMAKLGRFYALLRYSYQALLRKDLSADAPMLPPPSR